MMACYSPGRALSLYSFLDEIYASRRENSSNERREAL